MEEVIEKVDFLKMDMLFCILILQIVALCKAKRVRTLCWFFFYLMHRRTVSHCIEVGAKPTASTSLCFLLFSLFVTCASHLALSVTNGPEKIIWIITLKKNTMDYCFFFFCK